MTYNRAERCVAYEGAPAPSLVVGTYVAQKRDLVILLVTSRLIFFAISNSMGNSVIVHDLN